MPASRTHAVFPDVARERGHYESFYLRASHPSEPLGIWIRHTVHKPPGAAPAGSVWFTLFEAGGPHASKVTVGEDRLSVPPGDYIQIGESEIGPGRAAGSAVTDQLAASWQLTFGDGAPAFRHLPREWMYRARVPRTKTLSPNPHTMFSGRVSVGDRAIEVDGWPGMVGHNWGAEHAERWIWTNGTAFDSDGEAYLDAATGRIKLGPVTTPWIGNGVLYADGELHRLGGIERTRSTVVPETPQGAQLLLPGKGGTRLGGGGARPPRLRGLEGAG